MSGSQRHNGRDLCDEACAIHTNIKLKRADQNHFCTFDSSHSIFSTNVFHLRQFLKLCVSMSFMRKSVNMSMLVYPLDDTEYLMRNIDPVQKLDQQYQKSPSS